VREAVINAVAHADYAQPGAPLRVAICDERRPILDALTRDAALLTSEIAEIIDLTPRATRTRLARAVGQGDLRELGTGPQDPKHPCLRTR